MKMIFVVWNFEEYGKRQAIADTIKTGENLIQFVKRFKKANICSICESRRHAEELAQKWNTSYKKDGTYLEGVPTLH